MITEGLYIDRTQLKTELGSKTGKQKEITRIPHIDIRKDIKNFKGQRNIRSKSLNIYLKETKKKENRIKQSQYLTENFPELNKNMTPQAGKKCVLSHLTLTTICIKDYFW